MPDGMTRAVCLSQQQGQAVFAARDWFRTGFGRSPFFYLAGYAGSGKSTIIPNLIDACGLDAEHDVAFCAPTGKAALVMGRKLRAAGVEVTPRTVHRTLYAPPEVRGGRLGAQGARGWTDNLTFRLDPQAWVGSGRCRLIVVDEASMIGTKVGQDLMSFGKPVLVIGDPGQLPPVEEAGYFTAGEPDFFLSEIHRQARDNPIIALATDVRQGLPLRYGTQGDRVRIVGPGTIDIPDRVETMPQVICGTHRRRWTLTDQIRQALGFTGKFPQPGERLICCKNSRTLPELINGVGAVNTAPVGIAFDDAYAAVLYASDEDRQPLTRDADGTPAPIRCYRGLFDEHDLRQRGAVHGDRNVAKYKWRDLEHFDWGWAITCHKSQGSAWDEVLVWDESHVFRQDWKRWLYTAITRASERLTIITG